MWPQLFTSKNVSASEWKSVSVQRQVGVLEQSGRHSHDWPTSQVDWGLQVPPLENGDGVKVSRFWRKKLVQRGRVHMGVTTSVLASSH